MSPRPLQPRPPADEERPPARARRSRSLEDDRGAKFQANRAAFAAIKTLRVIRGYLFAYAVIAGLVLAAMLMGDAGAIAVSVTLGIVVVSLAGGLLVIQQPLVWTVVNAVMATPIMVWALLGFLSGRVGLFTLLAGLTGLGFWAAVPMAAKLQKLMRQHPDLWAFRRTPGELTQQHTAKWRAEAQRTRRRVLVGLGLAFLAIVGLGFWVSQRTPSVPEARPLPVPTRSFEGAEMDWRSAWNASRVDEVKGFLAASEKAQHETFFDRQRKKRGWDKLPMLPSPQVTDHGGNRRSVEYALNDRDIPLKVYWEWEPERWVVVNWSFPNR